MRSLSSNDVAIAYAILNDTLVVEKKWSERFQDHHYVISDHVGTIEVQLTESEANERVDSIKAVLRHIGKLAKEA